MARITINRRLPLLMSIPIINRTRVQFIPYPLHHLTVNLCPRTPTNMTLGAMIDKKGGSGGKLAKGGKRMTVLRKGGGKTWEDQTLLEWNPCRFRPIRPIRH